MNNTFLDAVSHELRTPLSAVLGLALTLQRRDIEVTEEDRHDLISRLASNARKLERLLTDLLDLDRLTRGIVEPKRQDVDIADLVARVVENSGILGDHPVTMKVERVIVSVDGPKVERIVENLLANAARHTRPGTRVWVGADLQDDGLLIAVEDEGPGGPGWRRACRRWAASGSRDQPLREEGIGRCLELGEVTGGAALREDEAGLLQPVMAVGREAGPGQGGERSTLVQSHPKGSGHGE